MATIEFAHSQPNRAAADIVTWTNMATGDTINSWEAKALSTSAASLQLSGTWGGATVVLQVSNDGTTWFTAKDLQGNDISATADAFFELSITARYIRPSPSGGTSDSVTATLVMRG